MYSLVPLKLEIGVVLIVNPSLRLPNVLLGGARLYARPLELKLGSFLWNLYAFYEGFCLYV
jgi:hypothetical protein